MQMKADNHQHHTHPTKKQGGNRWWKSNKVVGMKEKALDVIGLI